MGKKLEDLHLSDTPLPSPAPAEDIRATDWFRFSEEISDLLATGLYTWAESTLHDIQVTVEATKRVTEGQRRAVANIEAAANRAAGGRRSRRYEGFGR